VANASAYDAHAFVAADCLGRPLKATFSPLVIDDTELHGLFAKLKRYFTTPEPAFR
jgi:hypothetical protein